MALRSSRHGLSAGESAPGGRFTFANFLSLVLLLVLPVFALYRLGADWRLAGPYAVLISAISYAGYAIDKRRAQKGEWRISENVLHFTELLGGWPGAFFGQYRLRHKTSKSSYQFFFWFIVFAYQFAAFDSVQNWRHSKTLLRYVETGLR